MFSLQFLSQIIYLIQYMKGGAAKRRAAGPQAVPRRPGGRNGASAPCHGSTWPIRVALQWDFELLDS